MSLKKKPSVIYASGILAHADEKYLMDNFSLENLYQVPIPVK